VPPQESSERENAGKPLWKSWAVSIERTSDSSLGGVPDSRDKRLELDSVRNMKQEKPTSGGVPVIEVLGERHTRGKLHHRRGGSCENPVAMYDRTTDRIKGDVRVGTKKAIRVSVGRKRHPGRKAHTFVE